jgi:hypothetical protein
MTNINQPKIIDPVKNSTNGDTTGEQRQNIGDVYSQRDKGSVNSDFNVWVSNVRDVVDTKEDGVGSMRKGVKSYMNNYAFISFGSDEVGFGSPKNQFVSGEDINGLMASPDEWKAPTTKNIIDWSKRNKDGKPFNVESTKSNNSKTSSNQAKDYENETEKIQKQNNDQFASGGNIRGIGNFGYDWKDFVFCKNYGQVPNNRLLTLRRYKLPVLDNGSVGAKEELKKIVSETWIGEGQSPEEWIVSDSARALTYFGDGTDNALSGIFPFSVGLNWETRTINTENPSYNNNVSSDGTNFLSDPLDYLQIAEKLGIDNLAGSDTQRMITAGLVNNSLKGIKQGQGFGANQTPEFLTANVLQNDPYKNGWMYRIFGPVNVLLKTHSRKRGLKFDGGAFTLNFEYNMAQIGTMNPKLAMIDIISNMLALTTNSGSFWGGDYRFKRDLTDLPMPDELLNQLENMASGSEVDYNSIIASFKDDAKKKLDDITNYFKNGVDNLNEEFNAFKESILNSDIIKEQRENNIKNKEELLSNYKPGTTDYLKIKKEIDLLKNVKVGSSVGGEVKGGMLEDVVRVALNNGILGRNGDVKSLAKNLMIIKPLITGEPVGEWHLTVGNPMQPIAMIGNLICTGMSMTLSEELGYDDFPTSIKFKVTLDHGRDRDKGDIESMFNMGQGRTYLNIKGATPWETGFSTRSSDNDNSASPSEDYRNPDGTYGDSKTAERNPANKLAEDNLKLDKTKKDNPFIFPINNEVKSVGVAVEYPVEAMGVKP